MKIEDIAKICHEVNREFCFYLGDLSQVAWDEAPVWQKESAINGVKFALANPHVTPEELHDEWMSCKAADGWVYGPVKNAESKTHPCMVPYNELPPAQHEKDRLFKVVVLSCADKVK